MVGGEWLVVVELINKGSQVPFPLLKDLMRECCSNYHMEEESKVEIGGRLVEFYSRGGWVNLMESMEIIRRGQIKRGDAVVEAHIEKVEEKEREGKEREGKHSQRGRIGRRQKMVVDKREGE